MGYKWNPLSSSLDYFSDTASSTESLVISRIAGENISSIKVVYLNNSTDCMLANNTSLSQATVIGISTSSAITGGSLNVLSAGVLIDASLVFAVNQLVFLDINGNMTTTQPASGSYLTQIGFGLGAGSMYIKIGTPRLL